MIIETIERQSMDRVISRLRLGYRRWNPTSNQRRRESCTDVIDVDVVVVACRSGRAEIIRYRYRESIVCSLGCLRKD